MSDLKLLRFPDKFYWGTATSAYQIEGAVRAGGRGISIWDTFSHTPGKTWHGETGDVAADHYHRWQQDIEIMAGLGLNSYRFSIAWPRIVPEGAGAVNQAGLDFYDKLVDALLEKGIEPFPTLFHWDLPQPLQDQGGWPNRETAYRFADYARVVAERLGDRVAHWITHNEPFVAALLGHYTGEHAPGLQDIGTAIRAGHHLLLSHGLAVEAIRAAGRRQAEIGITLNLSPVYPASDSEVDRRAAARYDLLLNRVFLDPVLRGRYPAEAYALLGSLFAGLPDEDMAHIAAPLDFLGINYYSRTIVRDDPSVPLLNAAQVFPVGNEYSQMWEIYPPGIYELLSRIWSEYGQEYSFPGPAQLIITENGVCVPDGVDFDGRVRDERRIRYLANHLAQVHRAIADGIPITGYFVWSLLDNFEWALGYRTRFGLVYVDFESLDRTVKDSGKWYGQVIRDNGVILNAEGKPVVG